MIGQLVQGSILSYPTLSMRQLLKDPYLMADVLTNQIVSVHSCMPVSAFNVTVDNIQRCAHSIPLSLRWKGKHAIGYLDPTTNIIHPIAVMHVCTDQESTLYQVIHNIYEHLWHTGRQLPVSNISATLAKAFHPTIRFNPAPINIYHGSTTLIQFLEHDSRGQFLDDIIQTLAI